MDEQKNLFDRQEATRRREAAIEQVAQPSAAVVWLDAAMPVLHRLAQNVPEFTTDRLEYELRACGVQPPPEKRALGPLMRRGAKMGWITATDRVSKSTMPSNHRRPKAIWRSRILKRTSGFRNLRELVVKG